MLVNLKIILSITLLFFVGYMIGWPLLFGLKPGGVLLPLGLALLLYLYFSVYYFIALLILNVVYFKKKDISQQKIYTVGLILTNLLVVLLYSESIQQTDFLWTLVITNGLTILLIYISRRIFDDDFPELR